MNKDLTVGKPSQVLWQFCLPMFGSIIFQQLYNIADSLVAGKFIGENALAAVGNSYEITLIFIAFAFGCNIGCSVIVSRYFGAKEYDDMKTSVYTALIGSAVLCAVLMVFGLLGCRSLLELINTPEEILADSALYLDIYVLGLPFMFFYNIATGIFSALGDSKTPFYFLAVSSLSNIGVDILFVAGFHMGVAGVAWATFLCQGVSCILAMVVVFRRMKAIPAQRKTVWFSWGMLGKIAVVAIPSRASSRWATSSCRASSTPLVPASLQATPLPSSSITWSSPPLPPWATAFLTTPPRTWVPARWTASRRALVLAAIWCGSSACPSSSCTSSLAARCCCCS